jgi:2-polyprenyl-3-methyl-5-hydroxy-6-metoxy-1,4-benzoquinol methylase
MFTKSAYPAVPSARGCAFRIDPDGAAMLMRLGQDTGLELVPCPLCGRDDPQPTPYAQAPFRVVRCGGCRLWYLSPRPTEVAANAFYRDNNYFSGGTAGYGDYAGQEKSLRTTFRRLLRDLDALPATGGRLLEVGSGLGYFLDEARGLFAQRCGIELSPHAADAAAALADAPVHRTLDAVSSDTFDCIVALHVIEHVHEPIAFLRRLVSRLEPGGTLVLATPHMGSLWRRLMGRRWPSFKYPEHVTFFDAATLRRLFSALGFESATRLPYLHDFPRSEILVKLHLPGPAAAGRISVPLPATTICYAARRPLGGAS